jgi:hypothetical protein
VAYRVRRLSWCICARARSTAAAPVSTPARTSATKAGVSPEKLLTLAAWYENPLFDDAERAALAQEAEAQHRRQRLGEGPDVDDPAGAVEALEGDLGSQVYGPTIKELIHEQFSDGIMSAINFRLRCRTRTRPGRRPGRRDAGREVPALPVVSLFCSR